MEKKSVEKKTSNLSADQEREECSLPSKKEKELVCDESPKSLVKLMTRINSLLNENARLKSENKDLKKIYNQMSLFLKDVNTKNQLHKKSQELLSEFSVRMEKHEKKKD